MGLLNQLIEHLTKVEHEVQGTALAQTVKADLDHLCQVYDDVEKATAAAVEDAEQRARNWLNSRLGLTLPAPVDPAPVTDPNTAAAAAVVPATGPVVGAQPDDSAPLAPEVADPAVVTPRANQP